MKEYEINSLTKFLITDRYRLYRHLLFLLIAELFALQNTFHGFSGIGCFYANIINMLFFTGIIYLNIYILVPKLLYKNKYSLYILCISFVVLVGLFFLSIIQGFLYQNYGVASENTDNPYSFLHIITAIIFIVFIIIGSSTIVLFQQWILHGEQISELEIATMQSELNQLKNQINPHFLFNMLNNANELVRIDPEEASVVLSNLNDLLRYQLNDSTQERVSLSADIHFLTDYLNLEKIRRDNFNFTISKEGDINNVLIPPLIFITFVENAVKHNVYGEGEGSFVCLDFKVYENKLHFVCQNGKSRNVERGKVGGLGLSNIKRRLNLLYGESYSLKIEDIERTYKICLTLSL
uniref:sensor histidine kinase n=1 Tax=uncultured Dysgonomonas sp. TaxID=206096 RepID=UPI00260DC620|nr:histidine kinase [uncultured Dysgonomonas sp.]